MAGALVDVTDTDFETQVLKSDVPVLVDFWATWCGPCKAMSPAIESLAQELGDKLKVVKFNIEESQDVPSRYNVMAVPTLLLIKDGKVVKQVTGAQSLSQLKKLVEGAV